MVQLPYLRPFADINKRTSRLAAKPAAVQRQPVPLDLRGSAHRRLQPRRAGCL
jgi:hypothetical protein